MKTRSLAILAAVLACCAACSRKPEPAASSPTPSPAATPAPSLAAASTPAATPIPSATPRAIYVAYGHSNKVPAFDPAGAPLGGYTEPSDFAQAEGVAFNPANNTLYVSDLKKSVIRTFDATTGAETQIGFAQAKMDSPRGMALAGGKLFVATYDRAGVLAFDAATGAPVTSGFTAPTGLVDASSVAVRGNTLYVTDRNKQKVGAYDLATGAPVPGFAPIEGVKFASGLALYGNALFVSYGEDSVGEYDATTGAELNAKFVSPVNHPIGLAILGNRLLVVCMNDSNMGGRVGAYGLPAAAKKGDAPTSSAPEFIPKLAYPRSIVVAP